MVRVLRRFRGRTDRGAAGHNGNGVGPHHGSDNGLPDRADHADRAAVLKGPVNSDRPSLRVLVCTVVHNPEDARILHRQIKAMLDSGFQVTYAAPFSAFGVAPWPELEGIDVPRSSGRQRAGAVREARRVLREHGGSADIVLLHDPELLLALPGLRLPGVVVWDVHEDTGAALIAKPWLPSVLRPLARGGVWAVENTAERRVRLLLAEQGYRARFRKDHPVVPNTTYVPELVSVPGPDRVVYVGHLSRARGVDMLVDMARALAGSGVSIDVIGAADSYSRRLLGEAEKGTGTIAPLRWHGYVPNDRAMKLLNGAMAGLSFLGDLPNYRHSMPTKVLEYMAHGVPTITTPLPAAVSLVEGHECGLVVPFNDPDAARDAVLKLRDDEAIREAMGRRGHAVARGGYHWPDTAVEFIAHLERWAQVPQPHPSSLKLGSAT